MSGEAGGALLGGAILICAAPAILAGGAALAAGYGLIRGGVALAKYLSGRSEKKKYQKQIAVNNCSAELSAAYKNMLGVSARQEKQFEEFAGQLTQEMNSMGLRLSNLSKSSDDTAFLQKEVQNAHKALTAQLVQRSAEVRKSVLQESKAQLKACTKELEEDLTRKAKLETWSKKTAEHLALQKTLAAEALRDARASQQALKSIAQSSGNIGFQRQCAAIDAQLKSAEESYKAGMYQLAFSDAKNVVMQCAVLVSDHIRNEMETDMMIAEILAELETVYGEMEKGRKVRFTNRTNNRAVEADLNQFSQGMYAKMMHEIQKEIQKLMSAEPGTLSAYHLDELRRRTEEEIIPKAMHVMETAKTVMQQFYEREYALSVIAKHMEEQNYTVNWRAPVGGDPSQELVVNFVRENTGESVSVSLSSDAGAGDIADMALNIYSFTNGAEASEEKRQAFRRELMDALRKVGFGGSIDCLGEVNQSSDKTEYLSKNATLEKKTNTII